MRRQDRVEIERIKIVWLQRAWHRMSISGTHRRLNDDNATRFVEVTVRRRIHPAPAARRLAAPRRSQQALGYDVALDLGGPFLDGVAARAKHRVLPAAIFE